METDELSSLLESDKKSNRGKYDNSHCGNVAPIQPLIEEKHSEWMRRMQQHQKGWSQRHGSALSAYFKSEWSDLDKEVGELCSSHPFVIGQNSESSSMTYLCGGNGNRKAKLVILCKSPVKQELKQGLAMSSQMYEPLLNRIYDCIAEDMCNALNLFPFYVPSVDFHSKSQSDDTAMGQMKDLFAPYAARRIRLIRPQIVVVVGRLALNAIKSNLLPKGPSSVPHDCQNQECKQLVDDNSVFYYARIGPIDTVDNGMYLIYCPHPYAFSQDEVTHRPSWDKCFNAVKTILSIGNCTSSSDSCGGGGGGSNSKGVMDVLQKASKSYWEKKNQKTSKRKSDSGVAAAVVTAPPPNTKKTAVAKDQMLVSIFFTSEQPNKKTKSTLK